MPVALGTVASHRTVSGWSPLQLPRLLAWLDATVDSAFTYSNGNDPGNPPNTYVSQWRDLSGNGYHGNSNVNAGYHPKRNVTINGLKAVDYSTGYVGARKGLGLTGVGVEMTKPSSYFVVVRLPNPIIEGGVLVGSAQHNGLAFYVNTAGALGLVIPGIANIATSASGVVAPSTTYVLSCSYSSSGEYAMRANGNLVVAGTNNYSTATGGVVGVGSGTDNESGSAGAFIGEAIICNEVVSAEERQQVESYLMNKWLTTSVGIPAVGLAGWWDADDASTFTYSSGVSVSQWNDKSGVGNHVVQGNASRQPLRSGTRNGRTTLVFDGTRALGVVPAAPVSASTFEWTYFIVVIKTGAPMAYETLLNMNETASYNHRWWSAYNTDRAGGVGGGPAPIDYRTAFPTLSVYTNKTSRQMPAPRLAGWHDERINGMTVNFTRTGDNTNWSTAAQQILIGARGDYGTFLRGEVGEVILYDRYLTDIETQQVESYLATKWGTPIPPIPATGLQLWFDADDASTFSYSSGVLVSEWRDKSGKNRHATAGLEPSRNGSQNGRTTVVFNSHSMGNATPAITATDNYAIFTVSKKTGGGAEAFPFYNGRAANNGYGPAMTINDGVHMGTLFGGVAWHGTNSNTPSGHVVIGLQRASGVTTVYLNGVAETPTAANTPAVPTTGFVLGNKMPHGDVGGVAFLGDIAEVLVYDRVPSIVERRQIEAHLQTKWGTQYSPLQSIKWDSAFWASDPDWTDRPADGVGVSIWNNAGASNVDAYGVYGSAIYRASYAALNGRPALQFDNCMYDSPFLPLAQPNHVFVVGWFDPTHTGQPSIFCANDWGGSGTNHEIRNYGTGNDVLLRAGSDVTVAGAGRSGPFSAAILFNGASSQLRMNGTVYPVTSTVGTHSFGNMRIGGQPGNAPYKGGIAFIGIKATPLTTQELADLEAWAYTHYGVPVSGTPPFNPLSINWYSAFWASDPDWTPPADGGDVTSWRNAGTSAATATQSNPAWIPKYRAAAANLNNRPAIDGMGGKFLQTTHAEIAQPTHVFIVGWLDPTHGGSGGLVGGGDGNSWSVMNQGAGAAMRLWAGAHLLPAGSGRNGAFTAMVLFNGASSVMRVNGTTYSGDPGTFGLTNMMVLRSPVDLTMIKGLISFIGVKTSAFTADEISNLEAWAINYYGVPMP